MQYIVFYKSERPVPTLPPVPKISRSSSTSGRRCGLTSHRSETPSPCRRAERRYSSDDERLRVSDDDDVDDCRGFPRSSSENVFTELRDVNDHSSMTSLTHRDSVKKVAVTRNRTQALLRARGQCHLFVIDITR